jgi:hypothetical protein
MLPAAACRAAALGAVAALAAFASSNPGPEPWRFLVVDGEDKPTAARITLHSAEDGYLVPEGCVYWAMENQPGRYQGARYFYASGAFTVSARASTLRAYARKGLEFEILEQEVARGAEPTVLRVKRALDLRARGWHSGDGHVHPVSGRPDWAEIPGERSFHDEAAITDELLRLVTEGEDLALADLLASNSLGDEVHFAQRVTGADEPAWHERHRMRVSEEYRSEVFGHMSVFGVRKLSDPVFTALPGSKLRPFDHPTNHAACLEYAQQGAFPSFAHLAASRTSRSNARSTSRWARSPPSRSRATQSPRATRPASGRS